MKNWLYLIYIGLLGCLVSACQSSTEELPTPQQAKGTTSISLRLKLDGLGSRAATWEDNEYGNTGVVGSLSENEIDLTNEANLRVLIYSKDGNTLLGEVSDKLIVRLEQENGRVYTLDGILDIDGTNIVEGALECKVMVYANCAAGTSVYSHDVSYMPMWGVKVATLNIVKEGEIELGDVYLLRTMAKVEVSLSDEMLEKNYTLTAVKVDKYHKQGNVHPRGYAAATDTKYMDQQAVFNPNATVSDVNKDFVTTRSNSFHVYLPEYKNVGEGITPAEMTLTINGKGYTLHFKDYATGSPFNLVRNHYYQYTITGISEEVTLDNLAYDVVVATSKEIIVPPFE